MRDVFLIDDINFDEMSVTGDINEPPHNKTKKMAFAPSENSDQPGYPPSLTRGFAVRSMGS